MWWWDDEGGEGGVDDKAGPYNPLFISFPHSKIPSCGPSDRTCRTNRTKRKVDIIPKVSKTDIPNRVNNVTARIEAVDCL